VKAAVLSIVAPQQQRLREILEEAEEIRANAMAAPEQNIAAIGQESNKKLKLLGKELKDLLRGAERKDQAKIEKGRERLEEINKEVVQRCLGIEP
jgi:hypothetical protein